MVQFQDGSIVGLSENEVEPVPDDEVAAAAE
jgi:hypothetical protein